MDTISREEERKKSLIARGRKIENIIASFVGRLSDVFPKGESFTITPLP